MSTGIADLNGDARPDVYFASLDWPSGQILTSVQVWLQGRDGSFEHQVVDPVDRLSFPGQVFVKDFNRDGRADIYVGTFGNELNPPTASDVLYLQQRDGSFVMDERVDLPLTWAHGTSVGDLNNDGWTDVFSSGMGGQPSYIYWGSRDGFVVEETDITGPIRNSAPYVRDSIYRSRIQDFDGDGKSDLLIGSTPVHQNIAPGDDPPIFPVEIFYGYGRNDEDRAAVPLPDLPWMEDFNFEFTSSQIADLDNDGDQDLVLGYTNLSGAIVDGEFLPYWEVEARGIDSDPIGVHRIYQVLRNDGDRNWTDVTDHAAMGSKRFASSPFEINIGDYNGDGNWDISFDPTDNEGFLLGDGAFGFERAQVRQPFGWVPTIGDMTGDGVPDLVNVWSSDPGPGLVWEVVLSAGRGSHTVWYGSSEDDAARLSSQTRAFGGVGDDHVIGTPRGDRIFGGWNDDLLKGAKGADRLWGEHGNDRLNGASGGDRVWGGDGHDRLTGGGGNDRLFGGSGKDDLRGGGGADLLMGGPGADRLAGQGGEDTFRFRSAAEVGLGPTADVIRGFASGEDRIDLRAFDLTFLGKSGFTETPGELRWQGRRDLLSADLDGDGRADMALTVRGDAVGAGDLLL